MSKTITVSDETWAKIEKQVKEEEAKSKPSTVKTLHKNGSVLKEVPGKSLYGVNLIELFARQKTDG